MSTTRSAVSLPRQRIEAAWAHGFVHIKLLGDLSATSTALDESRRVARYLAKYVTKGLGPGGASPEGSQSEALHRYEVAQGFQPRGLLLPGRDGRRGH